MTIARKFIAALALWTLAAVASAQPIEVLFLGHSAFRITSVTGKVIVIDPFLSTNPRTPAKYKDLAALGKVDLILLTHGHRDHINDASELAKLTG
jgi:L-ascorbate metabolism protein UlaG (beta-lactamase superfamily)